MSALPTRTRPFELPTAAGGRIRGIIETPDLEPGHRPLPHVLILHGFKGFMRWGFFPELSRRIAAAGLAAVRFNMSGSGVGPDLETFSDPEAFARNTLTRELDDVEAVERHVRSGAFPSLDPDRAGLVGHSVGGALALLHAERAGAYRSVVTWAAVATFERFDEETVARWRRDGHLDIPNARTGVDHRLGLGWLEDALEHRAGRLDVRGACARLRTPVLLVHGTADEAVPVAEGEALAAALPAEARRLVTLEGAGHTFGAGHPLARVGPDLTRALDLTVAELRERLP